MTAKLQRYTQHQPTLACDLFCPVCARLFSSSVDGLAFGDDCPGCAGDEPDEPLEVARMNAIADERADGPFVAVMLDDLAPSFELAVELGKACPHCGNWRTTDATGGCHELDCVSRWFLQPTTHGWNGPVYVEGLIKKAVFVAQRHIDRTNGDRAEEAFVLMQAMEVMTGVDELGTAMQDAITHLMHLARMVNAPFAEILEDAKRNFDAEVLEDQDWRPGEVHP